MPMKVKQPFFSVIIPTTGGRLENLELVLTSLANQVFPKQLYEVIVVNDGGDKEALDLVKTFEDSFNSLKYIYSNKFEPLDFDKSLEDIPFADYLEVECWPDKDWERGGVENVQPRNKGVFLADADFLIFADSDIILCPTALACYFQDMMHNPDRIMLGVYHWLYPMYVTPEDVATRFDAVINEHLAKKMMEEVEPLNSKTGKHDQTHNIMRDLRMKDFNTYTPDDVLKSPGSLHAGMAMFSGNICWPRYIFEDIGGYTPYLAAGAHEDGFSGISAYRAGHGISYDNRIIGGHLYHHRNVEWVNWLKWQRCGEGELRGYINKEFADFDEMTDIVAATEEEYRRLGVADWKEGGPEW